MVLESFSTRYALEGLMEYKLSLGAKQQQLPELNEKQASVCDAIISAILTAGKSTSGAGFLIYGRPGAGRTSVALTLSGRLFELGLKKQVFLVPDRLRADRLQSVAEGLLPGVIRPVKTPMALAYKYLQTWFIERVQPQLAPQLLTGAREDNELEKLIAVADIPRPDKLNDDLIASAPFRMEMRNLFERVREVGLDGVALKKLGQVHSEPIWEYAGQLLQMWDGLAISVGSDETPALLSSAQLQEKAASLVQSWTDKADGAGVFAELDLPDVVVVDDLQDCTSATLELLVALAEKGVPVVATANPDVAIATYRGGEPHLDGRFKERLQTQVYTLGPTLRGNQVLAGAVDHLAKYLPVSGGADRRKVGAENASESPAVSLQLYASTHQEMTGISRQIQHYHLQDKIPYQQMAVITRRSAEVATLRAALNRVGIPTTVHSRAITYANEPVTAMLLTLLSSENTASELVSQELQTRETQTELLEKLVRSPLVRLDSLKLRRLADLVGQLSPKELDLGQLFRRIREISENDSIELNEAEKKVQKVLLHQDNVETVQAVKLALHLLELGQELADQPVTIAVWKLWQATKLETGFVEMALSGSSEAPTADDRLDAVISLNRTADVWTQRNNHSTARRFADEYLQQNLPTDNLATIAQRPAGVEILTAAEAAGRQWEIVFVAGVQAEVWPNLSIRNRITKAAEVTLKVNHPELANLGADQTLRALKTQARADELRTFVAAVSRADRFLHISAVSNEDNAQSVFFDLLADYLNTEADTANPSISVTEMSQLPVTEMRPLVAKLRRISAQTPAENTPEPLAEVAEQILSHLALSGVSAAHPLNWMGTRLSEINHQPIFTNEKPRLSPSAIDKLLNCPASWFLTQNGGRTRSGKAASLGTLVHAIAEKYPYGDAQQMLTELEERWDDAEFSRSTTIGARAYQDCVDKLKKMAAYAAGFPPGTVEVEKRISIDVGEAIIAGSIDRLEHLDDLVYVTDIKTGAVPTQKATINHRQLGFYQYALMKAGYQLAGARLLALKEDAPEKFIQPAITGETESATELREKIETELQQAIERSKGPYYHAQRGDHCRNCEVKAMCPLDDEGLRTVE